MSKRKHSFIQFYPDDWNAGTIRMPRLVRSVYFDICTYSWDKVRAVPAAELFLMTADLPEGQGEAIVNNLVETGTLVRNEDGSVYSPRALDEGQRAYSAWEKKSFGGKGGRKSLGADLQDSSSNDAKAGASEPEPEPEPEPEVGVNTPTKGAVIPREALDMIVSAWNAMARPAKLSAVAKMHEERIRKLMARVKEHGVDELIQAIGTIPHSDFLMGGGERGWKIDFDSFLRPDNCAKLIEGGYHNRGNGGRNSWTDR